MTRRKTLRRTEALLLCVFLCLGAALSMMGAANAASVEPTASSITVDITKPSTCTSGKADVGYCITDTAGIGFTSAQIKIGLDDEWRDVTDDLEQWENRHTGRIAITDNCPVTVRVIGKDGGIYEKMCYIDCFTQGTHIFLTNAMLDNPSVSNGTDKSDKTPSVNKPGNSNTAAPVVNPTADAKPTATPLKTSVSTSTNPQEIPDTTPRLPTTLTPNGQGTVVDNVTDQDSKEFFTFTTPNENIFYLVIDKQRESENVYFLNPVTESDLFALAEKDKEPVDNNVSAIPNQSLAPVPEPVCNCKDKCAPGEVNTDCSVCILTMKDCTGKAPVADPEPEKPEAGNSRAMILVVIAALTVGGAGYYLKIYKPKHYLDNADDFDDLTGEDEEPVNEDDLEPALRRGPRDEPEEPDYPEGYGYEEPEDDE